MQCPGCQSPLRRTQYEGLPVFVCEACLGYLLASRRLADIQRRREHSTDALQAEMQQSQGDRLHSLWCPRCHAPMDKQPGRDVRLGAKRSPTYVREETSPFFIDSCAGCDLVWLDPGELARIQLAYEDTELATEAAALRRRHETMSPQRRREFERRLAELPEGDATLGSAFGEGLIEALDGYWWD